MLKKCSLVTCLICVFMAFTNQNLSAQNFSLGLKAGPNIAIGRFKDSDLRKQFNAEPVFGFTAGGIILFPLKNRYSFLSEVAYASSGKKLKFNSDEWINTARFNFIDFSMALRKSFPFQLRPDVRSNIFVNIGPKISYWLNAKGNIGAGGDPTDYDIVFEQTPDGNLFVNYYNNINRWLFGVDIGVGGDAPITSKQNVHVEARFSLGQTNLGKADSSSTLEILGFEDDLRMNLKTFTLSATYTFDFDLRESKMGKSTKDKVVKKKKQRKR